MSFYRVPDTPTKMVQTIYQKGIAMANSISNYCMSSAKAKTCMSYMTYIYVIYVCHICVSYMTYSKRSILHYMNINNELTAILTCLESTIAGSIPKNGLIGIPAIISAPTSEGLGVIHIPPVSNKNIPNTTISIQLTLYNLDSYKRWLR